MSARSRSRTWSAIAFVAVLAAALAIPLPTREPARGSSLLQRLFGPVAGLAASAEWVRADIAFREGRPELAIARAQAALALDPGAAEGWGFLAYHEAFTLASPERERDPARRLAWIKAALETAAQGEARSRAPAELALLSGLILVKIASADPELPWPGGPSALAQAAAEHFERAGRLGSPQGADLARAVRQRAETKEQ